MMSDSHPSAPASARAAHDVRYLIFDVEAAADGELIQRVRYAGDAMSPAEAVARYRRELVEQRGEGRDFVPWPYLFPIALAVAKVDRQFRLIDLATLDAPEYRPAVMTKHFWRGWERYGRPTLVSYNGRGFDLPVLELAAFRYGLSIPSWFNLEAKTYEQPRNRFNLEAHIDLQELLSNFGATWVHGGLNLLSHLLGKPAKTMLDGSRVQGMFEAGEIQAINDYCRADVLDTYFVFLRTRVLIGKLTLEEEQKIVAETRAWLERHSAATPAYRQYLDHWGDWPGRRAAAAESDGPA